MRGALSLGARPAAWVTAGALACTLAPAPTVAAAAPAKVRKCDLVEFASGLLIVRGVSCRAAATVIHRALEHPGCTPTGAVASLGRGCPGTTRVGRWRCSGLFPGEGYDLRCHSGARRIHGGAGG
jgi:hypothetical protein